MAAVDFFLKIDGIEGESQDSKHKGEIELESFSFGASQGGTAARGSGMGAGKVHMQDLHFTMSVCKASPKLLKACGGGDHIKSAVLVCRKAGGEQQEYLKYTFSDLLVSSFAPQGTGADAIPREQVSLNFSKIEMEYKEQKADGTLGGTTKGWVDVKQNKVG